MTEHVKIKAITDDRVLCSCTTSACKSCSGNSFCNIKVREIEARLPGQLEIAVGDTVEIYLPPGKTIFAGFMVMILPLLLFGLFFYAAGGLLPSAGEGIKVLAGVGGLALGFLSSWLYARLTNRRNLPEITRILRET